MKTITLSPGVRLHAFLEDRFKSEYLCANFLSPPPADSPANGILLSSMLACGSARYPSSTLLNRALEEAYDTAFSCRSFRIGETRVQPFAVSWLSGRFIPDGFDTEKEALSFLTDGIFHPNVQNGAFDKEELQKQIFNRIDDLHAEKNNKQRYAIKQCLRLMCKDEPFARGGTCTEQEFKSVSAEGLYTYYQQLLQNAPIELYYFGKKDAEALAGELDPLFAPLYTEKRALRRDTVSPLKPQVLRRVEESTAFQSTLCLGFKTPIVLDDPLYPALTVMKEMLSDSPVSLLFTNVREKESLCYYCSASGEPGKGLLLISAGIDRKNAAYAEELILAQLEKMKKGDFEEELFLLAKQALIQSYKELSDSPAYIEGWYLRRSLMGLRDSPEQTAQRIKTVTKEQVILAANSLSLDTVYLLQGVKGGEHRGISKD
ncbi:MAG: insulinase family protein [Clostridia bacterium]|nr:insulinase family protein [Clostridia bacterium]